MIPTKQHTNITQDTRRYDKCLFSNNILVSLIVIDTFYIAEIWLLATKSLQNLHMPQYQGCFYVILRYAI